MQPTSQGSYSATVSLRLHVGDEVFQLSHVGPERVVLRDPRELPKCEAELEVLIDGRGDRQMILIEGTAQTDLREVRYAKVR